MNHVYGCIDMSYKTSNNIKSIFAVNLCLYIVSIAVDYDPGIAASVVIFVILSVSIEILQAISEAKA